ncbi:DUF4296 domain-containing protein [Aquimarina gracilis]|uniref:DUF4296 domain-containing protein n=1 Tax=Aquimarina gracilis TaxID=874422 RepID=A0ABU6A0F4_9FLAO|nr:DUF4296 domain-containing protein [Aquimarina gracilis]MEB3347637.1 DUF4296 domain-containing protein [Aquimarina gracilis]
MIKKNIYFVIVLIVFSCQSIEKPEKPEVFIEEDKMVEILTDMAFIKATKTSYRKVLETKKINPENYILNKHDIDSAVFSQNNIWYTSQLEKYEEIFKRVKANLETSKNKYEKLKIKEDSIKKVKDSIKKAKDTLNSKKEKVSNIEKGINEEIEKAKAKRFKNSSENE